MRLVLALLLLASLLFLLAPASAQLAQPTLGDAPFTWQEYGRTATCDLALHRDLADDEDRPHVAVLTERADNEGPSVVDDLRYVAEQIGRAHDLDPASVTWIVRWGAGAYEGAEGGKEIVLQASFRRTKTGNLSTPSWRVLSREQADDVLSGR
jgi:hypothetical protein